MDAVCVCLLARLLRRVAPRFSCPGLFVCLVLARAWDCNRRWLDEAARCDHARAASARGALCAVFGVCGFGCFSGDNKIGRLFGGASLWGFAFGLRLRASPSGPPEPTTRLRTHGRCPGSFPNSPQNTHGNPRSFLRQNVAVRRFGALPAPLVAIHLVGRKAPIGAVIWGRI